MPVNKVPLSISHRTHPPFQETYVTCNRDRDDKAELKAGATEFKVTVPSGIFTFIYQQRRVPHFAVPWTSIMDPQLPIKSVTVD